MINIDEDRLLQSAELVSFCTVYLEQVVQQIDQGLLCLKIPRTGSERKRLAHGHFHLASEIFLQLSGCTHFQCIDQHFTLNPQEICIMPHEIPHAEKTEDSHGIFYNLVFALRATTMSFHLAKQGHAKKPAIFSIEHYEAVDTAKCLEALNNCAAYYWNQSQYRAILLKGSLLSLFARLLVIMTETRPSQLSDHPAISTCKKIIVNNLSQSNLSTNYLADTLQYSPAYLSFLFKQQTGENLLAYIRRKRFERARELLKTSPLNISEVAWTCGFNDPGYFTRLFTRHFHMTPTQFRSLASSESFAD